MSVSGVEFGPVFLFPKKSCACQKVVLPGATIGSMVCAAMLDGQAARNSPLLLGPYGLGAPGASNVPGSGGVVVVVVVVVGAGGAGAGARHPAVTSASATSTKP